MIIRDGLRRLKTIRCEAEFILDTQWKNDINGDWWSEGTWRFDHKQALRLQEDIRIWIKENPE